MAPVPKYRSSGGGGGGSYYYSDGGTGLSVGTIVGVVIVVLVALFVILFIYNYFKARRSGQPVQLGHVFGKSLKLAFCGACLACVACFAADGNGNNQGNAGNTAENDGGYAPGPQMVMPQGPEPQMNWQPVQSAAVDPVQG
jgi:hypothetical protein